MLEASPALESRKSDDRASSHRFMGDRSRIKCLRLRSDMMSTEGVDVLKRLQGCRRVERLRRYFQANATVPSSAASSVRRRTSLPSARMTKMSVAV